MLEGCVGREQAAVGRAGRRQRSARALTELKGAVHQPRGRPMASACVLVDRKSHVLIADRSRCEAVRWIAPSTDRDVGPTWSPDSKRLAFARVAGFEASCRHPVRPQPWSLGWRRADGKGRAVWTSGGAARDSFQGWFGTDDVVLFAGQRLVSRQSKTAACTSTRWMRGCGECVRCARRLTTGD